MRVIGKYIRDDNKGMLAMIKKADASKKYAEALCLSKFAMRQIHMTVDVGEKAKWSDLITQCDNKMRFWELQEKFNLNAMLAYVKKFSV